MCISCRIYQFGALAENPTHRYQAWDRCHDFFKNIHLDPVKRDKLNTPGDARDALI